MIEAGQRTRSRRLIAAGLGLGVFFIHALMPVSLAGGDTLWSIPLSESVVHQHNVDLNEYAELLRVTNVHTWQSLHGRVVGTFPWGPSIVSAPFVWMYEQWMHLRHESLRASLHTGFAPPRMEIRIASLYVALSTVLLFLLLARRTRRVWLALFVSVVFAFGTSMLSTVSRALWSHTPSVLFSLVALSLLQVFEDHPEWRGGQPSKPGAALAFGCGTAVGLAYFVRPTNVAVGVLLVVLASRRLWAGAIAAAGAALAVLALVWINLATIGVPLEPYYMPGRASPGHVSAVALAGNLVSPARGLLVWSPVVIVAFPAMVRAVRRPANDRVLTACVAIVVCYWLVISTQRPWWAGWSVGPRLFSDALPYWMLLVAEGLAMLAARPASSVKRAQWAAVAALAVFSLFTNVRAASTFSVQAWNFTPGVESESAHIWDWSAPQFLR